MSQSFTPWIGARAAVLTSLAANPEAGELLSFKNVDSPLRVFDFLDGG
jgi:hypothetical protein